MHGFYSLPTHSLITGVSEHCITEPGTQDYALLSVVCVMSHRAPKRALDAGDERLDGLGKSRLKYHVGQIVIKINDFNGKAARQDSSTAL